MGPSCNALIIFIGLWHSCDYPHDLLPRFTARSAALFCSLSFFIWRRTLRSSWLSTTPVLSSRSFLRLTLRSEFVSILPLYMKILTGFSALAETDEGAAEEEEGRGSGFCESWSVSVPP